MAEQVGRQNTRALTTGEQAAYERMAVTGGASAGVFSWDIMNLGPSDIWVRWDGTDAVVNDPNAISLPANTGYQGAITTLLTVAADQATTITFVVNDRG